MKPEPKSGVLQGDEEARRRQWVRDEVRARFARYGDRPCACILEAALQPHGLHRLLEDVGLPFTPVFEKQLELIARFIGDHGSSVLVNRHQRRRGAGQNITKVSDRQESGAAAVVAPATVGRVMPGIMPPGAPHHGLSHHVPGESGTPKEWFDARGNYIGPERRMVSDRRSGIDRRDKIDAVNKNKRYGGDRRKGRGRRKTDR